VGAAAVRAPLLGIGIFCLFFKTSGSPHTAAGKMLDHGFAFDADHGLASDGMGRSAH
jgi:hypothetical protein